MCFGGAVGRNKSGRKKDFKEMCLGCLRRHPGRIKSLTIKFNNLQFHREEESKQPIGLGTLWSSEDSNTYMKLRKAREFSQS